MEHQTRLQFLKVCFSNVTVEQNQSKPSFQYSRVTGSIMQLLQRVSCRGRPSEVLPLICSRFTLHFLMHETPAPVHRSPSSGNNGWGTFTCSDPEPRVPSARTTGQSCLYGSSGTKGHSCSRSALHGHSLSLSVVLWLWPRSFTYNSYHLGLLWIDWERRLCCHVPMH